MKYEYSQLVNEDGTPTAEFMKLWRADKESVKANNLFLGKEGGKWVVKPGRAIYRVKHGGGTIPSGTHYSAESAQKHLAERVLRRSQPTYWVGRYGYADRAKALAEAGGNEAAIREEPGRDISGELHIEVSYDRPKFGTPEERAARRAQWMEYAEARRMEAQRADYRPSRWELNYTPTPVEDVEK